MTTTLRQKTAKGLLWSSIDNFANMGIYFVIGIVLARLLAPKDFGVIAMLTVFTAVANLFMSSGFGSALVRKPDRTEEDFSTAFYFNIIVGFVCYGFLYLISPIVASFYNEPILSPLLKVTSLGVVFGSLCVVQQAHLTINVDFKTQAKISLPLSVLSGVIGIILAYCGFGCWALAIPTVVCSFLRAIVLWGVVGWRPKAPFSMQSFRYLFGYGSKLLASGLLDTLYTNIYPVVIGKFFSSVQLGLYSKAQGFAKLPSSNLTTVLQRVTFPVLSMIQEDDERLRVNYRRLLRASAFVVFPLMVGLSAMATPLVRLLITSKWDDCIILLQIVCFALMWYPIHAINLNLLQVKGRSDLFLRLEIIKKIIGIAILCVTIPHGLVAMCYGQIVSSILCLIVNTYYTRKLISVGFIRQMRDLFPTLCNAFFTGCVVFFAVSYISNNMYAVVVGILLGGGCYFMISYIFRFPELKEIALILHRK